MRSRPRDLRSHRLSDVIPATAVTIDETHLPTNGMHVGDTFELTAATTPADSTDTIAWSASAGGVLAVAAAAGNAGSATVTAAHPGTATVTATAGEVTDTTESVTVLRNFAFVGNMTANPNSPGWNLATKYSTIPAAIRFSDPVTDAGTGVTTWTAADIDLYEGAEFKIHEVGNDWDHCVYGAKYIGGVEGIAKEEGTSDRNISVGIGGTGKYDVVVTETPATTEGEASTISIEFTNKRTAATPATSYTKAKIGLRGTVASITGLSWDETPDAYNHEVAMTEGAAIYTFTNIAVAGGDEFKAVFALSEDGTTYGDSLGYLGLGNLSGVTLPNSGAGFSGNDNITIAAGYAGTLTITVRVNYIGGGFITAITPTWTTTPSPAE